MDSLSPLSRAPPSYSARSTSTASTSLIDSSPCLSPVVARRSRSRRRKSLQQQQIPDFTSSRPKVSDAAKTSKRREQRPPRKSKRRAVQNLAAPQSVPAKISVRSRGSNGKASYFTPFGGSRS